MLRAKWTGMRLTWWGALSASWERQINFWNFVRIFFKETVHLSKFASRKDRIYVYFCCVCITFSHWKFKDFVTYVILLYSFPITLICFFFPFWSWSEINFQVMTMRCFISTTSTPTYQGTKACYRKRESITNYYQTLSYFFWTQNV